MRSHIIPVSHFKKRRNTKKEIYVYDFENNQGGRRKDGFGYKYNLYSQLKDQENPERDHRIEQALGSVEGQIAELTTKIIDSMPVIKEYLTQGEKGIAPKLPGGREENMIWYIKILYKKCKVLEILGNRKINKKVRSQMLPLVLTNEDIKINNINNIGINIGEIINSDEEYIIGDVPMYYHCRHIDGILNLNESVNDPHEEKYCEIRLAINPKYEITINNIKGKKSYGMIDPDGELIKDKQWTEKKTQEYKKTMKNVVSEYNGMVAANSTLYIGGRDEAMIQYYAEQKKKGTLKYKKQTF